MFFFFRQITKGLDDGWGWQNFLMIMTLLLCSIATMVVKDENDTQFSGESICPNIVAGLVEKILSGGFFFVLSATKSVSGYEFVISIHFDSF